VSDKRVEMKTAFGIGGPIIQVTTARGGRKYELPLSGSPSVPSVTTVVGETVRNMGLEIWREQWIKRGLEDTTMARLTNADKDAILSASGNEARASAEVGSHMHDIIDGLLQGNQEVAVSDQLEPAVRGFLRWRQKYADWEYIDSEVAVYFADGKYIDEKSGRGMGYAGTVDALFHDPANRRYMVVDWKTSSGIFDSAMMQVGAYCHALDEMLLKSGRLKLGVKVEGMVVRFDNNYPLDGDGKKVRTLPKVFSEGVQIARVDREKWWPVFRDCYNLRDGREGAIKKEWL
jgi:hypothetical protein